MNNTLADAFLTLNLSPYTHISVRRRLKHGFEYVGGGYPETVLKRYGNALITDTSIIDDVLIVYIL